ncbi:uroporphyrinogen-III C-methyltransferase [Halomonas llamarensis]|uniref:uroporphyrinogen-III C-methyltransferase n=1 Tax=Halomonas llamarensis TaxID=2945104 RepID=A0ABT0SME6_9GAMM|nr:uroporphyrinogen-III C-methyltransferase [Halomonas llamarensis]MCL7928983.1 uroporphyrinogen-III C-methyltransferase [Halomonas llamarensis]
MALFDSISYQPSGSVSLVGAGPGDPELLTLKAYRRLQAADIVLYDRLVSQEVLDMIPERTRRFYVGKACSCHSVPQEGINQSLVDWAKAGNAVVRLKGGDPFIFGRGGEELEALAAERITVEVIPGITAASGCAAYAGIPLTHRDYAQSVSFVTGHLKSGRCDLDWQSLARPGQTLVFYMSLGSLSDISQQLIAHGLLAETPLALVSHGTTQDQRVDVGTLTALPERFLAGEVVSPALLIVGEVVALHTTLAWFDAHASQASGYLGKNHSSFLQSVN